MADLRDVEPALTIEIAEAGRYRLELFSLGDPLRARLEDAEGWPLTVPGPLTSLERRFDIIESAVSAGDDTITVRHPRNADVLVAGTCPAGLYLSTDGGQHWRQLDAKMPAECVGGAPLTPRVTWRDTGGHPQNHQFGGVVIPLRVEQMMRGAPVRASQ